MTRLVLIEGRDVRVYEDRKWLVQLRVHEGVQPTAADIEAVRIAPYPPLSAKEPK